MNPASPAQPRRRSRAGLYLAVAATLAVSAGLGVVVLSHPRAVAAPAPRPRAALTITAASPQRVNWPLSLQAQGAVAAWQEASVGAQIGGYELIDVRVNVGDQVKKGQVLARFNPALLRADEAQLQASDEQAEANRKRILSLKSSGAVSDQDLLQYVTQAKTADALLASKRLQIRYTDVLAPDDGAISARTATLGAVVPTGQELFRLIRQNRLEWRGELTAAQLSHIRVGQEIALILPDGTAASARVRQTAPSLDPLSRLGFVYADIARGSAARAGMYADGHVILGTSPATVVPAQSVVIRDGRSYVLKLIGSGGDQKISLAAVSVGRRQGDLAEIIAGIGSGDRVAVQGAGFLNEGDAVRVEPSRSGASA
jgi:RND family efflux transporter MFP subunit